MMQAGCNEPFLEPLARVLADPAVLTVFVNGPGDVRVERHGRFESLHVPLTLDEFELMAGQLIQRARMRPGQVLAGCRLEGGLRADLVRGAANDGGMVLVLARERGRLRGLEEVFGYGDDGLAALTQLRDLLAVPRGLLVVAPQESLRSGLLMALVEDLPAQERVVLIDGGRFATPRHPHLVRLTEERSAGLTRARLLQALPGLHGQRLVLDQLGGPELREVLLGGDDLLAAPVTAVAGTSIEQALDRLCALGRVALRGAALADVEQLLASRFGMALLVGEGARRRPLVLQMSSLVRRPASRTAIQLELLRSRSAADGELAVAPPLPEVSEAHEPATLAQPEQSESPAPPPAQALSPVPQPAQARAAEQPQAPVSPRHPVLEPAHSQPASRAASPDVPVGQRRRYPSRSSSVLPAAPLAEDTASPAPPPPPARAERESTADAAPEPLPPRERAPSAPPTERQPPWSRPGSRAAYPMRTVVAMEAPDDILDEVLASLPESTDEQPESSARPDLWGPPPAVEPEEELFDDSLLDDDGFDLPAVSGERRPQPAAAGPQPARPPAFRTSVQPALPPPRRPAGSSDES